MEKGFIAVLISDEQEDEPMEISPPASLLQIAQDWFLYNYLKSPSK
jgi:hypothetical protein